MSEIAISMRQAGKQYLLFKKPQDRLKHALAWRFGKSYGRPFWALQDVSFDIRRGESVGVIGRNGSGKSTLLQILAGTLQLTTGESRTSGRVGALLELGSGFNPEYTGRENVFMNGAVLGLSPNEMEAHFSDILAFADIGEFIDQPVKLYSSGMVMRLAFAVQAMVPKDILIVDEALAVGDEAFQRKCMRALEKFRDNGGTVLLVSHSAQTIVRQCNRCLFLNSGRLVLDGPSKPVTDIYQTYIYGTAQQQREILTFLREHGSLAPETLVHELAEHLKGSSAQPSVGQPTAAFDRSLPSTTEITYGGRQAEIFDAEMLDDKQQPVNILVAGQCYTWRYRVRFHETAWDVKFGMMLRTVDGIVVVGINTQGEGHYYEKIERQTVVEVQFVLRLNLAVATFYIESGVVGYTDTETGDGNFLHRRLDMCVIRVISADHRPIYGLAYLEPQIKVIELSTPE